MALTYALANDAILAAAKAVWDTDAQGAAGTAGVPVLVFEELERDLKPHPRTTEAPWARLTVRHGGGHAAALGRKRWRRTGTIFIQAFVPATDGLALPKARALAAVGQKAYETSRGSGVSFKDAAVAEKGIDGSFYRADCTVSFWWDEIR